MRTPLAAVIAIAILVIFGLYMVSFTVRYNEVAVVTTLGEARQPARDDAGQITDPGSLKLEPGLYFKAPPPIQTVTKYPRQLQLLEDELEQFQTADEHSVVMSAYLAWRIEDPHQFFQTLKSIPRAEEQLRGLLRNLKGVVTEYRFDQLVNRDPAELKLNEIEDRSLTELRRQLASIQPGYGIAVEQFGIRRLSLPEDTTEKVFERMRKTRERLAETARAEGDAAAETIRSEAESARQRIEAFAQRRAEAIRAEGDREAAQYYAVFDEDEQFAVFLRAIDAMKKTLSRRTQIIMQSEDLLLSDLLMRGPEAVGISNDANDPAARADDQPAPTAADSSSDGRRASTH